MLVYVRRGGGRRGSGGGGGRGGRGGREEGEEGEETEETDLNRDYFCCSFIYLFLVERIP